MSFDTMTYGNSEIFYARSLASNDKKSLHIDFDFSYLFGFHTIIIIIELDN